MISLLHRRARWVLAATLALAALAGFLGRGVADRMQTSPGANFKDPGAESVRAGDELQAAAGVDPDVGIIALGSPAAARRALVVLRASPAITNATASRGRAGTYVAGSFRPLGDEQRKQATEQLLDDLGALPGLELGGPAVAGTQISDTVQADLKRAELIAFPLLVLLSFWVFRGVVAALLPPLVGGATVALTFFLLQLASEVSPLSIFALNLVTGLGLGLSIDYSLFVISRYREELERHGPGLEALRRTYATAGRTVLFSALTVAAALASLLVFPQRFLWSMGVGGVLVSLAAAAVALVALPAALALLGTRVNALAPARWQRPAERGGWYRLSRFVMRRPAPVAALSATLLILLGLPFLGIRFTGVDATALPRSESARRVADAVAREPVPQRFSPIYVAARTADPAALRAYVARLRALPDVQEVLLPRRVGGDLWRVDAISREKALAESSQRLVGRIRALEPPFPVAVGGGAASFRDQQASLKAHLPLALLLVALTTLALLFALTRSVLLPLKALLLNLLTLSAAFGALVLIFQDGHLEGLLGFESQGALESTQPILLFALAFGLATDYGVFLLSRIKEAHDAGETNREAVALGVERTGRIVTAAMLLFCVAIGAFATSRIVFIKELAVGTGIAVFLDATLVRALLVPSLMALLGDWNWWAPTLRRPR